MEFLFITNGYAQESLTDRLLSSDAPTRQAAILETQKDDVRDKRQVIFSLEQALQKDPTSAEHAAEALGALGGYSEGAVLGLVDALHFDEDTTAHAVSDALLKIGPVAIPALQRLAGDSNFIARRRGAEILGRFGPKAALAAPTLVRMTEDVQFDVHSAAENALVQIGDGAVGPIADELKNADDQTRRAFVTLLGKFGPAAMPPLARALLKDEDPFVRVSAADAIGQHTASADNGVLALTQALNDTDDGVRGAVADAFGQLGAASRGMLGPLVLVAHTDKDPLVQRRAQDAIDKIVPASNASVSGFIRNLRSDDSGVRLQTVKLIGSGTISAKEAIPLLSMVTHDADAGVRSQVVLAAKSLEKKEPGSMTLLFKKMAGDSDEKIRASAAAAFGK